MGGRPTDLSTGAPPPRRREPGDAPARGQDGAPRWPAGEADRGPGRKRRRRRKPATPVDVAVRAITQSTLEADASAAPKLADDPLSVAEVAEMKRHLRFLREYRRVLNLKVNAQEDLLLNERREPTHRGVCQHLLGKVDRKRVFGAAERMDALEAARLVEGVLAIAPDVDFVLLYLDCVRRAGAHQQAVAALAEALARIDFAEASPGQMRRVLDLVVELFDARSLPSMLLGLLEGKAFRQAFDAVAPDLPPALGRLVVPLRAAQGLVLHARPSPSGAAPLREGLRLILHGDVASLVRRPVPVRRRLLETGIDAWGGQDEAAARALLALLDSLQGDGNLHGELGLTLARALIRAERDEDARRLLGALARAHPELDAPRRWLRALEAPRLARIALGPPAGRSNRPAPGGSTEGRRPGIDLATMRPVWLYFARPEHMTTLAETEAVLADLCLPGVVTPIGSGDAEGERWLAVPSIGVGLDGVLEQRGGAGRAEALALTGAAVAILSALAGAGAVLPDAHLRRFEVDAGGHPWLVDVRRLVPAPGASAASTMLGHARDLVRRVLDGARRFVPPAGLPEDLPGISSFAELARRLADAR